MKPKDIGAAYDQITERWLSGTFNQKNGIEAHKRALDFVKNCGDALDVGCGCNGRFIDLLQEQGFTPQGVDVSEKMIQLARKQHPKIVFHHQDICRWQPPQKYDFITAWDSLWHLPLDQHEPVMKKLVACLNPGGILIFSFGGTEEAGEHTNNVMGPEVYYSSLGTRGFLELFNGLECLCRHLEYDQHPELHAYLIIQKL